MTVATGTSNGTNQILLNGVDGPGLNMAITIGTAQVPPPLRLGYFYLYLFTLTPTTQVSMIARGPIYRPGIAIKIPVPAYNSSYKYRLDAVWNPGTYAWTANIN